MAASDNKSDKKNATAKASKKLVAAEKPASEKKAAVARKSAPKKSAPKSVSAEERYRMTEVAAYFMAERNKFAGSPVEYWQAAEAQINAMLGTK